MSEILKAAAIFAADDLKYEEVEVPTWGGAVRLRELCASEAMRFTQEMEIPENAKLGMYLILIFCACDTDNAPVFPLPADATERVAKVAEYVEALQKKNLKVLDLLQRAALRVNAMLPASGVALKKD